MEIKVYNSLNNKKEKIKPIKKNEITMYVCGPTVYDYPHIGNARPAVVFDLFYRLFKYKGYKVKYASNITDVDDKIINKAISLNKNEKEISEKYSKAYFEMISNLNCLLPNYTPHVTNYMKQIIDYIDGLIKKDYAYKIEGNVYFDVSKIKSYGMLSNLDKEKSLSNEDFLEHKNSPFDFVLWKKKEKGISWESSFGKGRPGWHSECVLMIKDIFGGGKIDIHGGGNDLKFPHHENEIAQSCASHGDKIANYWLHNGMIYFDKEKMSKSKGNFKYAKDIIKKYGGNPIRLSFISTNYRSPLYFSDESLKNFKIEIEKIENSINKANILLQLYNKNSKTKKEEDIKDFLKQMCDDLNSPNGLSVFYKLVKELNVEIRKKDLNKVNIIFNTIFDINKILGFNFDLKKVNSEEVKLYFDWVEAKEKKDYKKADEMRKKLTNLKVL